MKKRRRIKRRKKKKVEEKKVVKKIEEVKKVEEKKVEKKKSNSSKYKYARDENLVERLKRSAGVRSKKGRYAFKSRGKGIFKKKNRSQVEAKLQNSMKTLQGQPIPDIDEVNIFKKGEKVVHFTKPNVTAAMNSNVYLVSGDRSKKVVKDLCPDILNQLPQAWRAKYMNFDPKKEEVKEKKEEKKEEKKIEEKKEEEDDLPGVDSFL